MTPRTLLRRLTSSFVAVKGILPAGHTLPDAEWLRRHDAILKLLWLLCAAVPLYGLATGHPAHHDLMVGLMLAGTTIVASRVSARRGVASLLTSYALFVACAASVHMANGAIEASFSFFVCIIVVSLYEDWRPFLLAFGVVVLHHGIMGVVEPVAVYNHAGNPWKLGAIHGAFVLAAAIASLIAWRFNEDVREKGRLAEERARETEALFRGAFADGPVGMALLSATGPDAGAIINVNRALCAQVGYSAEELIGCDARMVVAEKDIAKRDSDLRALITGEISVSHREVTCFHHSGDTIDARVSMSLVCHADGTPSTIIVQFEDVTERKQLDDELQRLAEHDPLTGLYNRRRFEQELGAALNYDRRYGSPGAVIVLDLDHFKGINDTLGHAAGDEALIAVADVLKNRLRSTDSIARLGGDEFAVLLRDVGAEEAELVAATLVNSIRDRGATGNDGLRCVTASLGVLVYPERGGRSADALLNAADLAMYEAKDHGGNRHVLHVIEAGLGEGNPGTVSWPDQIRRALDQDRLTLYAQPIVDIASGRVTQHEILVRMIAEDGEIIPPSAFLPVAERSGMVLAIDRRVIEKSIELLAEQSAARTSTYRLQVNLSGRSLSDPGLLGFIEGRLEAAAVDPARLVFEVTETEAIANLEDACQFLDRLVALGCTIALDDFGSGFGSLQYLKSMPVDQLKIDGSFIKGLTESPDDLVLVDSLVRMARGLGKRTVAEFVENAETLELITKLGIDYAQGYFLGRPGPAREVLGLEPACAGILA